MTSPPGGAAERLERQFRFLTEIDRLKSVERQSILCDGSRRENSAEHSWHLAVAALCLAEHATAPGIDRFKVIKMLLLHDIVEVDAGDAFLHEPAELAAQAGKEEAAAERIFGLLPEDQGVEFLDLWHEFESGETGEAILARALDRVQPAVLHDATDGIVWHHHGTTHDQIQKRIAPVKQASPTLWAKVQTVIAKARAVGHLR
jgi:putative hydrolases of HD superfamily